VLLIYVTLVKIIEARVKSGFFNDNPQVFISFHDTFIAFCILILFDTNSRRDTGIAITAVGRVKMAAAAAKSDLCELLISALSNDFSRVVK